MVRHLSAATTKKRRPDARQNPQAKNDRLAFMEIMSQKVCSAHLGGLRPDFRTADSRGHPRPRQNAWLSLKFFEALDAAAQKVSPLRTLQDRFACVIEVNHAAEVGVIPAAKWNSRNEVFLIHKAKGLQSEQLVVVPAKVVQADPRLAKSVDAVYQPNRIHHG